MDVYHIWCDLAPEANDLEFVEAVDRWLGVLRERGAVASHRIQRRKLGLAPSHLGEFHIQIEVRDLAQLDRAFELAAARSEPAESAHFAVNHRVRNTQFALYRDFPDPVRSRGEERF